jgi:hypothetical protein
LTCLRIQSKSQLSYVINNPLKYTDPSGYAGNTDYPSLAVIAAEITKAILADISSGSLARQSPLRLCPKAVYAMRSTMLPCPSVMVSIEPRLSA